VITAKPVSSVKALVDTVSEVLSVTSRIVVAGLSGNDLEVVGKGAGLNVSEAESRGRLDVIG
jgi:hypothetical protein